MGNCFGTDSDITTSKQVKSPAVQTQNTYTRQLSSVDAPKQTPTRPAAPNVPQPPFPDPDAKVVVALHGYDARTDDDLTFQKGIYFIYIN